MTKTNCKIFLVIIALLSLFASSERTGTSVTAGPRTDAPITNTANAVTEDGNLCSITGWNDELPTASDLDFDAFGFTLTASDTVDSIGVKVKCRQTAGATLGRVLFNLKDTTDNINGTGGLSGAVSASLGWTYIDIGDGGLTFHSLPKGTGADPGAWNFTSMSWSSAVINHANFGFRLTVGENTYADIVPESDPATLGIDTQQMTVFYHSASAPSVKKKLIGYGNGLVKYEVEG